MIAFASFSATNVFAAAYILGWDLVDSGKHCDVDHNDTKYESIVTGGMKVWNAYKNTFRNDTLSVIQDVKRIDYSEKGSSKTFAITYSSGKIKFNKYWMDKETTNQRKNTVYHELGHALGIAHSNSIKDVVYYGETNTIKLSSQDKTSYTAAAKKY
jgi:hypothetical protein